MMERKTFCCLREDNPHQSCKSAFVQLVHLNGPYIGLHLTKWNLLKVESDETGVVSPCRTLISLVSPCRTPISLVSPCRTPISLVSPCRTWSQKLRELIITFLSPPLLMLCLAGSIRNSGNTSALNCDVVSVLYLLVCFLRFYRLRTCNMCICTILTELKELCHHVWPVCCLL